MDFLRQRPILVGGLGLAFTVGLIDSVHPVLPDIGGTAIYSLLAVVSGIWWWRRSRSVPKAPALIDRSAVEAALALAESRIQQLETEMGAAVAPAVIAPLQQRLSELRSEIDRQQVRLSIMGGRSVGKTTLTRLLQGNGIPVEDAVLSVQKTAALETAEDSSEPLETSDVSDADLVLFVTAGDLTLSEYQTLQALKAQNHRLLLVFNKQDQYASSDRPVVLQQLRDRLQDLLPGEDIVAAATRPAAYKVRQHQADGSIQERLEQPLPDIAALQTRLGQVIAEQGQQLILATAMRQAQALRTQVQLQLNQIRRDRALPVIEQYQWIAAAAAFANPLPTLDLVATATISAQLVADLGALYQQPFSLDQAKTVALKLGEQMIKLGLVEMASQAIAPLLKSHALTYVAGGALQGLSAAYLTRLAGLSLVEYFQEQSLLAEPASGLQIDRLVQKLKAVLQDNQRTVFVQNLVKQGLARFKSTPAAPALAGSGEA